MPKKSFDDRRLEKISKRTEEITGKKIVWTRRHILWTMGTAIVLGKIFSPIAIAGAIAAGVYTFVVAPERDTLAEFVLIGIIALSFPLLVFWATNLFVATGDTGIIYQNCWGKVYQIPYGSIKRYHIGERKIVIWTDKRKFRFHKEGYQDSSKDQAFYYLWGQLRENVKRDGK